MEKLLVMVSQSDARSFEATSNGQKETIDVVEVTLTDGLNTFVASAFEKQAQRLIKNPVKAGAMMNVDLTFSTRTVKTEKGHEFTQQQVRLNNFYVIANP